MIFGEDALAHDGGGDGHGEHFGQLQHLLGGAGGHGAATSVEDGQVGVDEQIGGALHVGVGGAGLAGSPDRGIGQRGVVSLGSENVLVHFEHDRARGTGAEGG